MLTLNSTQHYVCCINNIQQFCPENNVSLSVAAGKKLSLVKGGNIKMGTTCKCIALDGDEGDTVSLLYDGTNWLITSKNIN